MRRYLLAATAAAATALTLFAGTAAAQPDNAPVSGDDRATAHSGNVVAKDCGSLYKGSTAIANSAITSSVDAKNTYLDITAVADGVEVTTIIVKGGPAYNQYQVSDLGNLPWLDLHAPLVSSGKPAQISHWFACGVKETTTTTTTTTTGSSETSSTSSTSSTSTTDTTDSSTPSSSTTSSESSSSSTTVTTTTTTSAAVAPVADEDDLASTGFSGGWMVALAALLLLGGAALLLVTRLRTRRR